MARPRGFTLIEVLVVVVIISIVTSVAMLSIGRNQTKVMQGFIREFRLSLELAEEQAMLAPAMMGLNVDDHAWYFSRRSTEWQRSEDAALATETIPDGLAVSLQVLGQPSNKITSSSQPQIIISSNGDITPFILTIGKRGEKPKFEVKGEADGTLTTEVLS